MHILIVDDDLEIRKLLGRYLTEQEFQVTLASDKRSMMQALSDNEISLIVLDVMLPDGSGLELCRDLRAKGSPIPVILLTALKEDIDRIIGLEIGADDYLGKPFNPRELLARIRAVMRRHGGGTQVEAAPREYAFGHFKLRPDLRTVEGREGLQIDLTGAEFDLLLTLVARPGRMFSRDQLLDLTGRDAGNSFDRSIDVLISRIRRKLGSDDGTEVIKTVRNGGYIFTVPVKRLESS